MSGDEPPALREMAEIDTVGFEGEPTGKHLAWWDGRRWRSMLDSGMWDPQFVVSWQLIRFVPAVSVPVGGTDPRIEAVVTVLTSSEYHLNGSLIASARLLLAAADEVDGRDALIEKLRGHIKTLALPAASYNSRVYMIAGQDEEVTRYLTPGDFERNTERPSEADARAAVERDEAVAEVQRLRAENEALKTELARAAPLQVQFHPEIEEEPLVFVDLDRLRASAPSTEDKS